MVPILQRKREAARVGRGGSACHASCAQQPGWRYPARLAGHGVSGSRHRVNPCAKKHKAYVSNTSKDGRVDMDLEFRWGGRWISARAHIRSRARASLSVADSWPSKASKSVGSTSSAALRTGTLALPTPLPPRVIWLTKALHSRPGAR